MNNKPESDDYKRGWYDGYHAAQQDQNKFINHPAIRTAPIRNETLNVPSCPVCGRSQYSNPYGCDSAACPRRIVATTGSSGNF